MPDKPVVTSTNHLLPFAELSPAQFERLCLWLVLREGYLRAEHLGVAGREQGRDVIAYKTTNTGEQIWYFQCKLYQSIGAQTLIAEIEKYNALVVAEPNKCPYGIVFVTNARLSAQTREKVRNLCQSYNYECEFWAHTELDERVKSHPEIVEEFFSYRPAQTLSALYQLPSPPRDFTGRVVELGQLLGNLQGGVTISGMYGMGGVGKTALALTLAEKIKDRYPDAQFFLDLKGTSDQPLTPAQAMEHVIRAYHREATLPEDEDALRSIYLSVLNGQRALIVWDNAQDAAQIVKLVPSPMCLMIVTSRHHFPFEGMRSLDLDVMTEAEAQALLLRIESRIGDEASRIVELCGRLPLALTLAANAIKVRHNITPARYADMLADVDQRLALLDKTELPQKLAATFQSSYELLDDKSCLLWRSLAVFPDTFDDAAAAAIWGWSKDEGMPDADRANDALNDLLAWSLIEYDEISARYRLHDLSRIFADARLQAEASTSESESNTFERRHARHFRSVLATANSRYRSNGGMKDGLALYDRERKNIEAGLDWVEHHAKTDSDAAELLVEYPNSGIYVWKIRLHPHERIHWLQLQLTHARRLKLRAFESDALGNLSNAYLDTGEMHKAIEYCKQQLPITREIGDRQGESNALGNMGIARKTLGEIYPALELFLQQLLIAREIGFVQSEINALTGLGNSYSRLGEHQTAIGFHKEALAISKQAGNRLCEGAALGNIGNAHLALGDISKSIDLSKQSLIIYRELNSRRDEKNSLDGLAMAYSLLGDFGTAIEYHQQVLTICQEMGDRLNEGRTHLKLGMVFFMSGDRIQCMSHAKNADRIFKEIKDPVTDEMFKTLTQMIGKAGK